MVPAYTVPGFRGSIARVVIGVLLFGKTGSPELIRLQLAPPSVVFITPPVFPTYTMLGFCGSIARPRDRPENQSPPVSLVFSPIQFTPPSMLLNTPPPIVPSAEKATYIAYSVLGVCGSIAKVGMLI